MSFERSIASFQDILENAEQVSRYMEGSTFESYQADRQLRDAVERCLQRISEAAIRLGSVAYDAAPQLPWGDIRGLGNWLRHAYDKIDDRVIYAIAVDKIPTVITAARTAISKLEDY